MNDDKKYPTIMADPKEIAINPENVRGEKEEQIEADEDFLRLKESVHEYGVIVPLVVAKRRKKGKKYILIDGERRLRAALATNQKKIPVHVISKDIVKDQMLLSFQIHMLRKEWSRTAQARALSKIIKKVEKEIGKKKEKEVFNIIQEKTGYSESKLKDLVRILRYARDDEEILDEIDNIKSNIKFSHLVQLEASFIEQIERTFPEVIKTYGIKTIRERMLEKVRTNIIVSTREPMEKLLPLFIHAKTPQKLNYLKKLIGEFIDNKTMTPVEVFRRFELKFPIAKEDLIKLVEEAYRKMEELESILNNLRYTQFGIYQILKEKLIKKINLLINMLKNTKKKIK